MTPQIEGDRASGSIRWFPTVATAFTIAFFAYAIWAIWLSYTNPAGADFVSYWAAAKLSLQGDPQLAYDIAAHRAVEKSIGPVTGFLPFPYPPPYLLLITPLALIPPWLAFAAWLLLTSAVYYFATRRLIGPRYAFANPAAHINALIGQNGLLTSGLFIGGTAMLDRNRWLAGALLGLLSFKPQLALLLPFALAAGRQWQAIGAAAVSAAIAVALSAAVFGLGTFQGFYDVLPTYVRFIRSGALQLDQLISVYAALRHFAVPEAVSIAVHSAVALFAAVVTWRAWQRGSHARLAVLASASLLISPYLFTYDALLLTVPLAYLMNARAYRTAAFVWGLLFLAPLNTALELPLPNTVPLATFLALCATDRLGRDRRRKTKGLDDEHLIMVRSESVNESRG